MLLYQKTLMKWNVNENNEWELTDEGPGIYQIQFNGESHLINDIVVTSNFFLKRSVRYYHLFLPKSLCELA